MIRFLLLPAILSVGVSAALPAFATENSVEAASERSTRSLYISLIRQARSDGRPRAAIAYLDDFDRQHPEDREAQLLRIDCLLDLDQVAVARSALKRIPSSDRSGSAEAMRGHVLVAEKNWKQATAQYALAVIASPTDAFIANALGYAQLRAGQAIQAIETLRRARDLAPEDVIIRNNLILALTVTGHLGEAETALTQVTDTKEKSRLRQQVAGEAARLVATGGGNLPLGS